MGAFELENVDEIPVPSVAVSCPRSKPHDMGYPVCELHIMSLTSTDEASAATKAADRFGFIAALLGEENTDAVIAALNYKWPFTNTKFGNLDTMTVDGDPLVWDNSHGVWAPADIDFNNANGYLVAVAQVSSDPYVTGMSLIRYVNGAAQSSNLYPISPPGVIVQDPDGPQITDFDAVENVDARAVQDFQAFGFYQTEDMGQETDRHWIDHLVFEVHCQPTDDLDGDGETG
jgi:hypothetical protein